MFAIEARNGCAFAGRELTAIAGVTTSDLPEFRRQPFEKACRPPVFRRRHSSKVV
jgi:hypothetical protein